MDSLTEKALEQANIPATEANNRWYSLGQVIVGINFFAAMFWGGVEGHSGVIYWLTAREVPPLVRFGSLSLLYLLPCVVLLLTRWRVPALFLGVLHPTLILAAALTILLPFAAIQAFAPLLGREARMHRLAAFMIAQVLALFNLMGNVYTSSRQAPPRNDRTFLVRLIGIQGVIFSALALYVIKFL